MAGGGVVVWWWVGGGESGEGSGVRQLRHCCWTISRISQPYSTTTLAPCGMRRLEPMRIGC